MKFNKFATLEGTTDDQGVFSFELTLPTHFVGQPLLQGNALLKLDAKITDKADHGEEKTLTLPVAKDPVRIALIPEGGKVSLGVPNHIFVVTSYPDGRPASTKVQLKIKGKDSVEMSAQTDSAGIADFTFTPDEKKIIKNPNLWEWQRRGRRWNRIKLPSAYLSVTAEAVDGQGYKGIVTKNLSTKAEKDTILIRSEKAIYQGGETLTLDIFSTFQEGNVYIDIIKNRQTLLTETVELKKGRAKVSIPATSDLFGTLECHAYKLREDANFIRDTRIIYVQPSSNVKISVKADKGVYRPGEKAVLTFQTFDKLGHPLPTALGITIVDEAVYALQEMQPGLEKVFFTLEKEISQPKYQIKYGPGDSIESLVRSRKLEKSRQRVARILFSKIGQLTKYGWKRNPQIERRAKIQGQLQKILGAFLESFPAKAQGRSLPAPGGSGPGRPASPSHGRCFKGEEV